ncbi:hypothetical protein [Spirosoma luteum]|uniref:hypothetical protein n=1 Tax=Spirosoma luteum TaxID=431553 RepID=UPI0003755CF0|nr:hypothetical protein [Spirosoma luteum]
MAKKKPLHEQLAGLPNLGSFLPSFSTEPLKINTPDLKNIKPISASILEAIEPIKDELARVTGELTKANERAELAEQRASIAEKEATKANRRSYWLALFAFIIPFGYAVWSDWQKQSEKTEVEVMKSTLQSLSREVQTLKGDIAKTKIKPRPAKPPLHNTEATNSKKP